MRPLSIACLALLGACGSAPESPQGSGIAFKLHTTGGGASGGGGGDPGSQWQWAPVWQQQLASAFFVYNYAVPNSPPAVVEYAGHTYTFYRDTSSNLQLYCATDAGAWLSTFPGPPMLTAPALVQHDDVVEISYVGSWSGVSALIHMRWSFTSNALAGGELGTA